MSDTVTIQDVGPIHRLTIPIRPGVTLLRGDAETGKSTGLRAVNRLAGGEGFVEARDKTAGGIIEGLGTKITVRRSVRSSGELEATSLEGDLDISDLVDPGIDNPERADAARIKALLRLTGVKADVKLFADILPTGFAADKLPSDVTETDDLVLMAARIKRALEKISRDKADEADKAQREAVAAKSATDGMDLATETDASILTAALEDALYEQGAIAAKTLAAEQAHAAGEQAQKNLATLQTRKRPTLQEVRDRLAAAEETCRCRSVEVTEAEDSVRAAEKQLVNARALWQTSIVEAEAATEAVVAAEREEELLKGWQESIEKANGLAQPTDADRQKITAAVTTAREAIERGAVVRAAIDWADQAKQYFARARLFQTEADSLRDAAKATDEVLSLAVACQSLKVKDGRLVSQHPERGEVFYADRSTGTRWRIAIGEVANRIRKLGAEKTALATVRQGAWGELSPKYKQEVDEEAKRLGVAILSAEATDGELRAETFNG